MENNFNGKFLEEYKRLDKLCKDMLCNEKGISTYIDIMDDTPMQYKSLADNWDSVYKTLKHLRWKRNRLAHDTDIDENFIARQDIDYVVWFYNQIMATTDPLAVIKQELRRRENEREAQKRRWQQNNQQFEQAYRAQPTYRQPQPKQSFFARLITKIKNWLDG